MYNCRNVLNHAASPDWKHRIARPPPASVMHHSQRLTGLLQYATSHNIRTASRGFTWSDKLHDRADRPQVCGIRQQLPRRVASRSFIWPDELHHATTRHTRLRLAGRPASRDLPQDTVCTWPDDVPHHAASPNRKRRITRPPPAYTSAPDQTYLIIRPHSACEPHNPAPPAGVGLLTIAGILRELPLPPPSALPFRGALLVLPATRISPTR